MTRLPRTALAAAALLMLTGCAPESGTVADRRKHLAGAQIQLQVQVCDGAECGWVRVSIADYKSCDPGDAWPACKEESR